MRMVGWRRDVGGCLGCDVCCAALLLCWMGCAEMEVGFGFLFISYSCLLRMILLFGRCSGDSHEMWEDCRV